MRKLYDFFLEKFYMPWGDYTRINKTCGQKVEETFQSDIYLKATIELLGISIVSLAIYYLILNNRFGRFYLNRSWFITFVLNASIISIITYFTSHGSLGNPSCNISGLVWTLSLTNFFFAIIVFFLLSFVFRRFSLMGRHTPYITTN